MWEFLTNKYFLGVILILNILMLITMIFFERKDPDKVLKWMGVLLFLPLLGFVFYIIFGKGPTFGKRKKVLSKLELDDNYLNMLSSQDKFVSSQVTPDTVSVAELIKYNIWENKSICTDGNQVELMTDMKHHFKTMYDDIKNAKKYINILYFIIKPDVCGMKFLELLLEKRRDGVEVRLVYDDVGSILLRRKMLQPLIEAGAKVYPFFPIKMKLFAKNVNYRNHRKIVVVDGEIAYTGGCNIAKEYISMDKKLTPWRDTHIRVKGNAVALINTRFLQDYNFASGENIQQEPIQVDEDYPENNVMQVVSSGPDSPAMGIETAYIKAIYSAEKFVYIQTPYLILDEPFKLALISAARSGIDVRIMIPGVPDKQFVYYSTLSFAEELVRNGVKVVIYPGFIHSKTLCIDGRISSVGTFNLDIRSFKLHFELTCFIYGEEFGKQMIDVFNKDQEICKALDLEYIKNRSIKQRFMERFTILFSPLL